MENKANLLAEEVYAQACCFAFLQKNKTNKHWMFISFNNIGT